MKRVTQNVLAQNSSGEIDYLCGKCGKAVEKDALVCPHCSAKLGNIRCPFCNFTGSPADFSGDTCPRCGRNSREEQASAVKSPQKAPPAKRGQSFAKKNSIIGQYFWTIFIFLTIIIVGLVVVFLFYYDFL